MHINAKPEFDWERFREEVGKLREAQRAYDKVAEDLDGEEIEEDGINRGRLEAFELVLRIHAGEAKLDTIAEWRTYIELETRKFTGEEVGEDVFPRLEVLEANEDQTAIVSLFLVLTEDKMNFLTQVEDTQGNAIDAEYMTEKDWKRFEQAVESYQEKLNFPVRWAVHWEDYCEEE